MKLKRLILFTVCLIVFYYSIMKINELYAFYHRYDEPDGAAIKVSTTWQSENSIWERLLYFYQNGE